MSRKSWDSFEKLYAKVESRDERTGKVRTRYEYQGGWHVLMSEKETLRLTKWICAAALVLGGACLIWAGTRVSAFNRIAGTALPVGLAVAAWIFMACGVVSLLLSGERWRSPEHDRAALFLKAVPLAAAALLLFAFLFGLGWKWIDAHPEENILPLIGFLVSAACAATIWHSFGKLEYYQEKPKTDAGKASEAENAESMTDLHREDTRTETPDPLAIFRREEESVEQ